MPEGPKIKADSLRKHGFGPDKVFSCYVAVDNQDGLQDGGTLVGYALYFFSFSSWEGLSVYLDDLYVRPSFRHRGIGGRLWRQVAKVAVQKGCNRFDWVVLGWNSGALEMYKAKGAVDLTVEDDWHLMRLTGKKLIEFAENGSS